MIAAHKILRKMPRPQRLVAWVRPADFELDLGEPYDRNAFLTNDRRSLYCFDDERRVAIFVELDEDVDLATVPFVYEAQYEHAERVLTVPYEELLGFYEGRSALDQGLFIFSSARSGSTLLAQMIGASGTYRSYSEPDYCCSLIPVARRSRQTAISLFRAATAQWLPARLAGERMCIKPRAFAMSMPHLFTEAVPSMKVVFIYRDCFASVESCARLWPAAGPLTAGGVELWRREFASVLPMVESASADELLPVGPFLGQFLLWCISVEQACKYAQRYGIVGVRYEDLCARPRQTIGDLFERLGIEDALDAALTAMDKPSQLNSSLHVDAPPVRIPDDIRRHMALLLSKHTRVGAPNGIVPGTV